MPVTIKDIARELGVAHSTVSRAIHDDPRISRETKQRVLEAVTRLGYRPNAAARGLVSRRIHAVGLVIPGVADMFYGRIVDGVDRAAYEAGFGLSLYLTHGERRRELDALAQVSERRVDGLIVMMRRSPKKVLLELAQQDIPLVLIEPQSLGLGIDSVRVDNRDGGYQAVRHLLNLGHRRIAFIAGPEGQREAGNAGRGTDRHWLRPACLTTPSLSSLATIPRQGVRRPCRGGCNFRRRGDRRPFLPATTARPSGLWEHCRPREYVCRKKSP